MVALAVIFISYTVSADKSRRAHCREHGHRWVLDEEIGYFCGHCGTEPHAR